MNKNEIKTEIPQYKIDRLIGMIYDQFMYEADMGEMAEVMEAAESLVNDWILINNIVVID